MKKIIFTLLIIILFIPNVSAKSTYQNPFDAGISILPNSCSDNILKLKVSSIVYSNNNYEVYNPEELTSRNYIANDYFIEVKPSTAYYFNNGASITFYINFFDKDFNFIEKKIYASSTTPSGTFTTPSNSKYILPSFYLPLEDLKNYISNNEFMINEGEEALSYVPYAEECATDPEQPDVPETPEPEDPDITVTDVTLDNFYTIFLSKLTQFSKFATENKFVLGAIAIAILLVVLDLLLYLFNKGGYR